MIDEAVAIVSLGARVRIRCDHSALRARIDEMYAACATQENAIDAHAEIDVRYDEMREQYEVAWNGHVCSQGSDAERALEWCAWLVNSFATTVADDLVLHAAAASMEGRGVLIAGPSGSGKSTLVSALVLAGLAYMGDDAVAVRDEGEVVSNPKPISIDDDSWMSLASAEPHVRDLCARPPLIAPIAIGPVVAAGEALPVSTIVRPTYRAGAPARLIPLQAADAIELLAEQTFNFDTLGGRALRTIVDIVRKSSAFVLEYGDLGAAVDLVVHVLRRAHGGDEHRAESPPVRPGFDVAMCADEAFIWSRRDCELHHLSASATAIWLQCGPSPDPEQIAAAVTGMPRPGVHVVADVHRCIEKLRGLGLLVEPG